MVTAQMMAFNYILKMSTQSSKKGGGALRLAQGKPSPFGGITVTLLRGYSYA
jgi:hypothetical protein